MNPKHLIVLENRKKKLTQHSVYHQSNSFLKEHRMMKTSLRLTVSFQGRKMQKMVVTNLLSSRNLEPSSEGHKTKKKIPRHHLYPYFFYLEHRKMKRNLTLHSVLPVHRMKKKNQGHYFSLKGHKMKKTNPGHHFSQLGRKMMKKNPMHSFQLGRKTKRRIQGHHSFQLGHRMKKMNLGHQIFQMGRKMKKMSQGHYFSQLEHRMRRKSREHRFSSMERRTTKMNLKLHFVFLGYKTMKRSQVLLLAYLQWNFVLYKRKKKNSGHPIVFQLEHRMTKKSPELFPVCLSLLV